MQIDAWLDRPSEGGLVCALRMRLGDLLGLIFLAGPVADLVRQPPVDAHRAAHAAEAVTDGESPLSPREHGVLWVAADHDTAAEIAARLQLSEGTVRNYLSAAIRKLGARNRREAVDRAVEKGWL